MPNNQTTATLVAYHKPTTEHTDIKMHFANPTTPVQHILTCATKQRRKSIYNDNIKQMCNQVHKNIQRYK